MHTDFYEAYRYLEDHKYFRHEDFYKKHGFELTMFSTNTRVFVVKVDPDTYCIEEDESRNTKTVIWLETGRTINEDIGDGDGVQEMTEHDWRLDCGGDTYEEAIIKLANLIDETYPNYGDE